MGSSSKPTIQVGSIEIDFLVDADDSGGSVTVFECFVPAGSKVPVPHSHDTFEETVYGLEGTCTWTIDGQTHDVAPGESACIRRGQVHGFENRTSEDVKFLAIATPGEIRGPHSRRPTRSSRDWRRDEPPRADAGAASQLSKVRMAVLGELGLRVGETGFEPATARPPAARTGGRWVRLACSCWR